MSDQMQAEMRDDIKQLLVTTAKIATTQELQSEFIKKLEEKIDELPANCGTGKDHEKRITEIERIPDKRQGKRKFLAPLVISIIALIASTGIGVISLIVK